MKSHNGRTIQSPYNAIQPQLNEPLGHYLQGKKFVKRIYMGVNMRRNQGNLKEGLSYSLIEKMSKLENKENERTACTSSNSV